MNGTHIAGFDITVADLDRSAEFYTRGIGLSEKAKEDHDDLHEVMLGGEQDVSVLVLVNYTGKTPARQPAGDPVKIVLRTDDAAGAYARGLEQGGTSVAPPRAVEEAGVTFAELRDPDGYVVQLIEQHS
jgi:lactoylglutathione lyase